jgi:hypothetical protein
MTPILTVELYTPGEIVDGRRSYAAETAKDALFAAKAWLAGGNHTATRLRVLDDTGTVLFDQPVTSVIDAPPLWVGKSLLGMKRFSFNLMSYCGQGPLIGDHSRKPAIAVIPDPVVEHLARMAWLLLFPDYAGAAG